MTVAPGLSRALGLTGAIVYAAAWLFVFQPLRMVGWAGGIGNAVGLGLAMFGVLAVAAAFAVAASRTSVSPRERCVYVAAASFGGLLCASWWLMGSAASGVAGGAETIAQARCVVSVGSVAMLVTALTVRDRATLRHGIAVLAGIGCAEAALALVEWSLWAVGQYEAVTELPWVGRLWFVHDGVGYRREALRASGSFGNPNAMSGFLVLCLGPTLAWWASGRRVLRSAAPAMIVLAIGASQSRTGCLGMIVALSVYGVAVRKKLRIRHLVVAGLLGCAIVGMFLRRWFSLTIPDQPSVTSRLEIWGVALRVFRGCPLLGVGPGMFGLHYLAESSAPVADYLVIDAHSGWLTILAEQGAFGFAAFVCALCSSWIGLARAPRDLRSDAAGILAGMVGFCVALQFGNLLWLGGMAWSMWILAGLALGAVRIAREDAAAPLRGMRDPVDGRRPPVAQRVSTGRPPGAAGRSPGGFTLIELMVVMGVVLVLCALLAPALQKARVRALSAKCQSNLRQLVIAAELYDQDFGQLPIGWEEGVPWENRWHHTLQPYVGGEIGFGGGVFTCPAAPDQLLGYAMNWLVNCEKAIGWRWSVGDVADLAGTVLLADGDGFNSCLYPDGIDEANCTYRHGGRYTTGSVMEPARVVKRGRANGGFFDGHVEEIRVLTADMLVLRRRGE